MASVTGITLFREKTTVHSFSFDTGAEGNQVAMSIRSNRIAINLKAEDVNETVVVRGQNIPSTLRCAAMVVESFTRNPMIFSKENAVNWADKWTDRQSSYERKFVPESWVSIHHGGGRCFPPTRRARSTRWRPWRRAAISMSSSCTASARHCSDATKSSPSSTTARRRSSLPPFPATTAPQSWSAGAVGRVRLRPRSTIRPSPAKPVRFDTFIHFCADLIEAVNVRMFLERVKAMVEENRISGPPITPAQVQAAMDRRRALVTYINAFERANKVSYRPERPELF